MGYALAGMNKDFIMEESPSCHYCDTVDAAPERLETFSLGFYDMWMHSTTHLNLFDSFIHSFINQLIQYYTSYPMYAMICKAAVLTFSCTPQNEFLVTYKGTKHDEGHM